MDVNGERQELDYGRINRLLYREGDKLPEILCVICLINFEEREEVRVLPCCHFFHGDCLLKWFEN